MKKFRLVMFTGNCENFGTEWEETKREICIVEAQDRYEVEEKYSSAIHDCDCKSYYIEELGAPCYRVMYNGECIGQYEDLDTAVTEFRYCLYGFEDLKDAIGMVKIEIGLIE